MDYSGLSEKSKFRVPYVNGKYLVGLGLLGAIVLMWIYGQAILSEWKNLTFMEIIEHKVLIIIFG
ncbi:hypothetical protein [Sphingobacterium sp. IITKGP-BTPF85]|uniref:hypothetical protein n=1 Tax=Sphingobacterium sp. IITKGP-BTPF85 TaxID=1338009 RepID=UPI00293531EC|nr:hypothetical protein [Sphingobacterium sp. IITKGP-BTPF85]